MFTSLRRLPFALDPLIAEAKRRMRRRRFFVALALVAVAAVAATLALELRPAQTMNGASNSAGTVMHGTSFRMPGNTVACELDGATAMGPLKGQQSLSCTVITPQFQTASRGQRIWGVGRTGEPRAFWVMGNVADTTPTLAHGRTWSVGRFTCTSKPAGLTCRNKSGHGFTLSPKTQQTF